jgi:2'-5' RNA ligase
MPLDAGAVDRVRRLWQALAEQAGADDAIRLGYLPHLTLAVLPSEVPISAVEEAMAQAVEDWGTFSLVLAGFGVFPGAAPVVTAGLLTRHASLCAALAAFGVHPHYRPGHWMPHVTLCQECPSSARAIEVVTTIWDGPITARLKRIELVQFPPVTVLRSRSLQPEG